MRDWDLGLDCDLDWIVIWIGLDQIGLDQIGLDWIGLDSLLMRDLDWIDLIGLDYDVREIWIMIIIMIDDYD